MSDPCKCQKCQDKIKSISDFNSHSMNEFIRHLAEGKVQHIGNDIRGQPVYRDVR